MIRFANASNGDSWGQMVSHRVDPLLNGGDVSLQADDWTSQPFIMAETEDQGVDVLDIGFIQGGFPVLVDQRYSRLNQDERAKESVCRFETQINVALECFVFDRRASLYISKSVCSHVDGRAIRDKGSVLLSPKFLGSRKNPVLNREPGLKGHRHSGIDFIAVKDPGRICPCKRDRRRRAQSLSEGSLSHSVCAAQSYVFGFYGHENFPLNAVGID